MTKEEAIERLEHIKRAPHINNTEWENAIDVAIKELTIASSGTILVRRTDAARILACVMYAEATRRGDDAHGPEEFMAEATAWMEDAPAVEPPVHFVKTNMLLSREDQKKLQEDLRKQNENIILLPCGTEYDDIVKEKAFAFFQGYGKGYDAGRNEARKEAETDSRIQQEECHE